MRPPSFSPASGAVGATVTLSGANFTGVTAVQFNGVDASFSVVSDGQLTATVPAVARSGSITVINPGGAAVSPRRR